MRKLTPREKDRLAQRTKENLVEYTRQKLSPHFGHLNLISKFIESRQILQVYEIDSLIKTLSKKNIIKILPKELNAYSSFQQLVNDISIIDKRTKAIRFIKDNVISASRDFFLELMKDRTIMYSMYHITLDKNKSEVFKRWSSRIKSMEEASSYIKDITEQGKYFEIQHKLEGIRKINGYDVIRMNDFDKVKSIMPVSWCIRNRGTFNQHCSDYSSMFIVVDKEGNLFGVNFSKHGKYIGVQDQDNHGLSEYNSKHKEITSLFDSSNWKEIENGDKIGLELKISRIFKNSKGIFGGIKESIVEITKAIINDLK